MISAQSKEGRKPLKEKDLKTLAPVEPLADDSKPPKGGRNHVHVGRLWLAVVGKAGRGENKQRRGKAGGGGVKQAEEG